MRKNYHDEPNGYIETIQKGLSGIRSFTRGISYGKGNRKEQIRTLKKLLDEADGIVIGAGSGLSTAAGLTYSGERFEKYFFDFIEKYGITDIYSGGFYPFPDEKTYWGWWARHIYYNRYVKAPKPVYEDLLKLVKGKDYFVITTNVDHQFQKAGFDKKRLFYTQGDYGLFQSTDPSVKKTFDNEQWVYKAMEAEGFVKDEDGVYQVPEDKSVSMRIPSELIPVDPETGGKVTNNLRADDSFVEDEGWHRASAAYSGFLRRHQGLKVVFLEMGVGNNTPVIIKYPFWVMTKENRNASYACLNYREAYCPKQIEQQSVCIDGDTAEILKELLK